MSAWHTETEGFREGLKALGYSEGRGVTFEPRAAAGDTPRLPALASDLVRQRVDLLFCVSSSAAKACQEATGSIPIVVVGIGDPVGLGLVKSVARPGGNLTGIANLRDELTGKRVELFKELVPALRRLLVTFDSREPEERAALDAARVAAARLGLKVLERPITAPLEIEPALAQLQPGGGDGILIVQSGLNLNIPGRSLEVATSNGIPTMYPHSFWSRFGALVSYGPDQRQQGVQAARLAHRILSGTSPHALPIELPERFELVVNLKTARRLGLVPSPAALLRADRVIE